MKAEPLTPLALSAAGVARLLSISSREVYNMDAAGTLGPVGLALGPRKRRWDAAEIRAWWDACRQAGRRIDRREWLLRQGDG